MNVNAGTHVQTPLYACALHERGFSAVLQMMVEDNFLDILGQPLL